MTGTTKIDFVGTVVEAQTFAAQHRSKFPRTFNVSRRELKTPNGDAQLCASWRNAKERYRVRASLTELGWPGDWEEVIHTPKKR